MGLEILTPEHETTSWVTATQRLWLTADGDRLVPDGHRDAAVLYCTPGKRITVVDARRFGLLGETAPVEPPVEVEVTPAGEAKDLGAPAENKEAEPPTENKAVDIPPAKPKRATGARKATQ